MSKDTIDLHDEIFAICEKLGHDPERVLHLDIVPMSLTANVARLRNGGKYVDEETNEPAQDEYTYAIRS